MRPTLAVFQSSFLVQHRSIYRIFFPIFEPTIPHLKINLGLCLLPSPAANVRRNLCVKPLRFRRASRSSPEVLPRPWQRGLERHTISYLTCCCPYQIRQGTNPRRRNRKLIVIVDRVGLRLNSTRRRNT